MKVHERLSGSTDKMFSLAPDPTHTRMAHFLPRTCKEWRKVVVCLSSNNDIFSLYQIKLKEKNKIIAGKHEWSFREKGNVLVKKPTS